MGGGALGDPAGFLAATYLRGVPWIGVPTTLVAQVDSSIGGKTGVDLPEGKNLVGAFHHPATIVLDVAALRPLPERQLRAALGEVVKMAALGDEPLFQTLEEAGEAVATGRPGGLRGRDRRGGGRAIRVGEGRGRVGRRARAGRHGRPDPAQPRAHGGPRARGGRRLRDAAPRRGGRLRAAGRDADRRGRSGVTPPDRAARIEGLLTALRLGVAPLPYPAEAVLEATGTDKKHAGGRLRWVLPTADGTAVRDDVPDEAVEAAVRGVLAGVAEVAA